MNKNAHHGQAIGRVNMVITAPAGTIVTPMIVRAVETGTPAQLTFSGPVAFTQRVQAHLHDTVFLLVTRIMELLSIPPVSFDLAVVNSGATASSDIGLTIDGFSSDVPAFMALLSAGLALPIRQDMVFTGHIASPDGDIAQVKGLPEKSQAAVLDKGISAFVFPNLDTDMSMNTLKPQDYENVKAAVHWCRGKLKLIEVTTIADLLEKTLNLEAIVHASLTSGFFSTNRIGAQDSHVHGAVNYLTQSNPGRFWDALESALFSKDIKKSHELVRMFAIYHISAARYPSRCGENLNRLILSLPSTIKNSPRFFPLLPTELYIQLIQSAGERDYNDILYLHNALFRESGTPISSSRALKSRTADNTSPKGHIDYFLEQLNPETIETTVTRVYDEARASYILDSVTVTTHEELVEAITGFYTHVVRHRDPDIDTGHFDRSHMTSEALDLLGKTFPGDKLYQEALAEARRGIRGGMRYILDAMTEYLKQEARGKHILKTFKATLDPLDNEERVSIIREIMKREENRLPAEITSQPPEKYAEDYEAIIKAYVESNAKVTSLFQRL